MLNKKVSIISKRTKLITTIGPSTNTMEKISEMANAGMTTIRINFSHGDRESQLKIIDFTKEISKKNNRPISILLDTKGPEIRVGKLQDDQQWIDANQLITIKSHDRDFETHIGNAHEFSVSYEMWKDVKKGTKILFDDGKLIGIVQEVKKPNIIIKTINSHLLKSNKRINIPGVKFSLPFLSQRDINDINFGIDNGIHYIAASFTNNAEDIHEIVKILEKRNARQIKIIAKIESVLGVQNIDDIIDVSDGIMVARGDLGLEVPYEEVPFIQKNITRKCRLAAKPVIIATQMLDSMEKTPIPTRAEVTDVYFAVSEGADCTMLSGESATGTFPILSVETMSKISIRAEREFYTKNFYLKVMEYVNKAAWNDSRSQMGYNIAQMAMDSKYKYAVVLSRTGALLSAISKFRPNLAIIGIVFDPKLIYEFGITSSVFIAMNGPKLYPKIRVKNELAIESLIPYGIKPGDTYLVVYRGTIKEFVYK